MAELFVNQAKQYAETRPSYPQELFQSLPQKIPLVTLCGMWAQEVGRLLDRAGIYKIVTGTNTSLKQLEFAPKLPNVSYHHTAPVMLGSELEETVSAQSSVDLFDLHAFYQQVKWILKKPYGVIVAWCYIILEVNDSVDSVLEQFHSIDSEPFWEPRLKLIDDKYRSIDFPFEAVEGADHTGPFKFVAEKLMDLDEYLMYLRSWSAYQTVKTKGVELPRDDMIGSFKRAWNEDGHDQKAVKFPVYLRIGKVGKE
uniref:Methyltransferase type 11 domain-containing protein n=1 Tax=Salix viminalis TaxID=40686 RepID=A0A6N2M1R7_SALVM